MREPNFKKMNVLFIAYFFPPAGSTEVPGAMRTIKFIRNLKDGQRHVLTKTPTIDESHSALKHIQLPVNGEQIHRIKPWDIFHFLLSLRAFVKRIIRKGESKGASQKPVTTTFKSSDTGNAPPSTAQRIKDFIYNLCYFPDQAGPWILPAFFYGRKLVKKERINAIFTTGSPWSGLFVGYLISKATGVPLIVDFRDPWMNNPFHQSKGPLLDSWSARMERAIVHHATAISLNTDPLMEEFLERYPDIPKERFFVMPNGFDLCDMAGTPDSSEKSTEDNYVTLCHAGFLYGVRDPAILLEAIRKANSRLEISDRKLRFRQIGDVQLSYDIKSRYADMLADGSLVLDPARPYQSCLGELARSEWVVNVQPATRSQVPSKLYDYLAINKPILNITPKEGALGRIVTKYELGLLFDFDEQEALTEKLVEIAQNSQSFSGYPARDSFDCRRITDVLAQKFLDVTR